MAEFLPESSAVHLRTFQSKIIEIWPRLKKTDCVGVGHDSQCIGLSRCRVFLIVNSMLSLLLCIQCGLYCVPNSSIMRCVRNFIIRRESEQAIDRLVTGQCMLTHYPLLQCMLFLKLQYLSIIVLEAYQFSVFCPVASY